MFRLIKKKLETLLRQRTAEKHFGIYLVSYLAKKVHKHYAFWRRHGLKSKHSCPTFMYKVLNWLQPCLHTVRIVTTISRSSMMILKVIVPPRSKYTNCKGGKNKMLFPLSNGFQLYFGNL